MEGGREGGRAGVEGREGAGRGCGLGLCGLGRGRELVLSPPWGMESTARPTSSSMSSSPSPSEMSNPYISSRFASSSPPARFVAPPAAPPALEIGGPPSHIAQNAIGSRPAFSAWCGGSRINGVMRQVEQGEAVRVQPFSMYSPSCR